MKTARHARERKRRGDERRLGRGSLGLDGVDGLDGVVVRAALFRRGAVLIFRVRRRSSVFVSRPFVAVVVAGVADDLGASADNVVPIFFCDELGNARVRPFFTSRNDLRDTWVAAGRTAESVPTEVTVVDLKSLVSKMRAGFAGIDWKTSMFIASQSSIAKAQEIQEVEAKEKGKEFDAEAEPPPLE